MGSLCKTHPLSPLEDAKKILFFNATCMWTTFLTFLVGKNKILKHINVHAIILQKLAKKNHNFNLRSKNAQMESQFHPSLLMCMDYNIVKAQSS